MFKQTLFLALAVASVSANLGFTDCGSSSRIIAFRLIGCDAPPCRIHRGQTYYGELDVQSGVPAAYLPMEGTVVLGFPYPPVSVSKQNACNTLSVGSCPIHVGDYFTARFELYIPANIPTITTALTLTVGDGLRQTHGCANILITLIQ